MRFTRSAIVFAALFLAGGVAVAALSLRDPPARRLKFAVGERPRIPAAELARWIIAGRRDFTIVDLREKAQFERGHVRGAVSCGTCHESKGAGQRHQQGDQFVDLSKNLILYTDSGREEVLLPRLIATHPRIQLLEGGYRAWEKEILAPVSFGGETSDEELLAKKRQEAVRAFFAGERIRAAPAAKVPIAPLRKELGPKGAPREGC